MQVDEYIIELVRDNKCLYDKTDEDYKNTTKKKHTWNLISDKLKDSLDVDMPADKIEKRWSSLRDMFNREHKKQTNIPSGSGYRPSKTWDLYSNMLFMTSHISHRRTVTTLPSFEESVDIDDDEVVDEHNDTTWRLYEDVDTSSEITGETDDTYEKTYSSKNTYEKTSSSKNYNNTQPTSSMSLSGSFYGNRKPLQAINTKNHITKNTFVDKRKVCVPEIDQFAKKKVARRDLLEKELGSATSLITAAVKTMTSRIDNKEKPKEGCIGIIEEGLSQVPAEQKIQCIIELLQVVQKFTKVNAVNNQ